MKNFMQFTSSKTIATAGEDGNWTVVGDVTSGKTLEDGTIDTRTISSMAYDTDLDKAFDVVSRSLQAKFKDLNSNLFNLPKELDGKYIPHPLESH